MIYAMHAINLWHTIHHWCNRGSIGTLECSHSLQLVATWCKMVEMIATMMAIVVIVMVIVIVTPSSVDSCWHSIVHCCNANHVHLLHAWYHHYCRVIAIAGVWYHWHRVDRTGIRRIAMCSVTVQYMYTSVKLTCTCLLLLVCRCN